MASFSAKLKINNSGTGPIGTEAHHKIIYLSPL
jgi:hypothetical protein